MTEKQFEEACEHIRQGDKDGLKDIYQAYLTYIFQVIYRVVQNRENAEDITADFFIKLWDLADKYCPGRGHKTWITTIARNMAIDYIRAHKKELLTDEIPDVKGIDEETVSSSNRSHGKVESEVERNIVGNLSIEQALLCLKDCERQVIHMKILGDLTFKEISSVLGVPMGTVTWRYQNAIQKLRRCGYE